MRGVFWAQLVWASACGPVYADLIVTTGGQGNEAENAEPGASSTSAGLVTEAQPQPPVVTSGDDEVSGGNDNSSSSSGEPVEPGTCLAAWLDGPTFGPVVELESLNSNGLDADPRPARDGLSLVFASARGANRYELYRATRDALDAPFGAPTLLEELSSPGDDTSLTYTYGPPFIFSSTRDTGSTARFYQIEDLGMGLPIVALSEFSDSISLLDPHLRPGGLELYWTADTRSAHNIRSGARASLSADFAENPLPQEFENDNYEQLDDNVSLDETARVAVFGSDRPNDNDSHNLWYATRQDNGSPFGAAIPLDAINTDDMEREPALSPDSCTLYFTIDRMTGTSWDIFSVSIEP